MTESRTICVDIDGVIAGAASDYCGCPVVLGARQALERLRADGWYIILHTGRHINHAETTLDWLRRHHIPYDLVQFGKPPARHYVDDRAIRFTNWSDVLDAISSK